MTQELKITINDKEYTANPGQTILEVIREYKIDDIPTLCWDPKLPPYGSCYLCVIEVKGLEKLVPSCSSPVSDGMVVYTNNERIRESRKTALELLLSNHYADCLGPCTQTCPAGVDVQGYIALMAKGDYREAVKLIKKTNPLPIVCGRVCVRECETACRRNRVDDRVGIDYLKRYATDIDIEDPWIPEVPPRNGKRVAVAGGGPAGLTCAYFLTLKGYAVTIFEKSSHLGGMLRYGIPEYRLPKKMLDREIKWITDLGVEVRTNAVVDNDMNITSLKKTGFDAIFLAIGAQKAKGMGLPGEDTTHGVIKGADFLHQVQTEDVPALFGRVVVVGGGNTAIDAARTALRVGAEKVTILYRRTQKEMPAHQMEIDAALEEGVELIILSAPTGIITKDGRLHAITCIRMELGEPDASGRRSPVPMRGSEYDLMCDFVISAIGQDVDPEGVTSDGQLATTRQNAIAAKKGTFETSIPGVFAGGDAITGPAVAIDAIAHGKDAAEAIDQFIRTGEIKLASREFLSKKDSFGEIAESEFVQFKILEKEKMPELHAEERIKSMAEVELGFTEEQAFNETSRCLECGCSAYFDCALRKYASDFGVDITRFLGDVRKFKIDQAHPFIALDPNKCISCGRCVRTCSEIVKVSALGFVYRGFKSVVKPSMEKKLLQTSCISCGNCIAACPTGAITEKLPFPKPGPWVSSNVESICSFCSVGCNLSYRVFHDHSFTVANVNGDSHNKGYLCTKGRFGYRYMMDKDRLLTPMIKKKGGHKEAVWDEAIEFAAKKLESIIHTYGPQSVAVFGSPRMTNEELYLLQKFVRAGLKTNNIGSFTNLLNGVEQGALDEMFGVTVSTATMDDLRTADVVLVINADVSEENLVAELKIKRAQKRGASLVTVNSSETQLNKFADLCIDSKRGANTALINWICKVLTEKGLADTDFIQGRTEGFEELKASISSLDVAGVSEITGVEKDKLLQLSDLMASPNKNIIIVYNVDSLWEKSRNDLKAIGNLMMLTGRIGKPGNGIIIIRDFANSQGLMDMGVDPGYLPGNIIFGDRARMKKLGNQWGLDLNPVFKPVDLKHEMETDRIKALLVFGEDPLNEPFNLKLTGGAEFLLVVDHFVTATALEADVILPASLPIETSGSFTSCDRRVQGFGKVFEPKTGMENWQIISKLSAKLNFPLPFRSVEDIQHEIRKAIPAYKNLAEGSFWGKDLFKKKFLTASGKGKFGSATIQPFPFNIEKKPYLYTENYFNAKIKGKLME
jgi:formate dehydrogenase major subunit